MEIFYLLAPRHESVDDIETYISNIIIIWKHIHAVNS